MSAVVLNIANDLLGLNMDIDENASCGLVNNIFDAAEREYGKDFWLMLDWKWICGGVERKFRIDERPDCQKILDLIRDLEAASESSVLDPVCEMAWRQNRNRWRPQEKIRVGRIMSLDEYKAWFGMEEFRADRVRALTFDGADIVQRGEIPSSQSWQEELAFVWI